jgi:hypothetical protein
VSASVPPRLRNRLGCETGESRASLANTGQWPCSLASPNRSLNVSLVMDFPRLNVALIQVRILSKIGHSQTESGASHSPAHAFTSSTGEPVCPRSIGRPAMDEGILSNHSTTRCSKVLFRHGGEHGRSSKNRPPMSHRKCILGGAQRDRGQARYDLVGPVGTIDSQRQQGNLSSALRLFVLAFYRSQIPETESPEGASPDDGSS